VKKIPKRENTRTTALLGRKNDAGENGGEKVLGEKKKKGLHNLGSGTCRGGHGETTMEGRGDKSGKKPKAAEGGGGAVKGVPLKEGKKAKKGNYPDPSVQTMLTVRKGLKPCAQKKAHQGLTAGRVQENGEKTADEYLDGTKSYCMKDHWPLK